MCCDTTQALISFSSVNVLSHSASLGVLAGVGISALFGNALFPSPSQGDDYYKLQKEHEWGGGKGWRGGRVEGGKGWRGGW